jgi:hypothetical protein
MNRVLRRDVPLWRVLHTKRVQEFEGSLSEQELFFRGERRKIHQWDRLLSDIVHAEAFTGREAAGRGGDEESGFAKYRSEEFSIGHDEESEVREEKSDEESQAGTQNPESDCP